MTELQTDWNEVWKNMKEQSWSQIQENEKRDFEEIKKKFLKSLKGKDHSEIIERQFKRFPLSPDLRVLDIGSGPGRMALSMAPLVAHITAVEPDDISIAILKDQIAERGITNITTVHKRWEDVDIDKDLHGKYDLVIAFGSVGGMFNIRDAVEKMCEVSKRWVYLATGAGTNPREQAWIDLWPKLYGREYNSPPKANILYNLLYDMGIYPDVRSERVEKTRYYSTTDDVAREFETFFGILTLQQEETLKKGMIHLLEKTETGYIQRQFVYGVTFWWDVTEIDND